MKMFQSLIGKVQPMASKKYVKASIEAVSIPHRKGTTRWLKATIGIGPVSFNPS